MRKNEVDQFGKTDIGQGAPMRFALQLSKCIPSRNHAWLPDATLFSP